MLLECFHRLEGATEPGKLNFRFVLSLLLLRRKRLRVLDTVVGGKDRSILVMGGPRGSERYQVVDPGLSDSDLEAVQEDIFRVLGWE
jgi:hypothetical protein